MICLTSCSQICFCMAFSTLINGAGWVPSYIAKYSYHRNIIKSLWSTWLHERNARLNQRRNLYFQMFGGQTEKDRGKVLKLSFSKMKRRQNFQCRCSSKETSRTVQALNLDLIILLNPGMDMDGRSAPGE